jgi:hypothetical protein
MSRQPILSACITVALAALLGAAPLPSWAAWESIGACPASNFAKLKRSDNRPLRLAPGREWEIEVFGHLLDTVRDVRVSGIAGATARNPRGVSGFDNGGRGVVGNSGPDFCALGSLKVDVSIPANTARGARGMLEIGGERIALEVVTDRFSIAWDGRNDSASLSPGSQEQVDAVAVTNAADAERTCRAAAETDFQHCTANRPALDAARAQQCAQTKQQIEVDRANARAAGASGVSVAGQEPASCRPLQSCEALRFDALTRCRDIGAAKLAAPRTPRCLRELGGSSLFLADGTLQIVLPPAERAPDAALEACLSRGFDVVLKVERLTSDYSLSGCVNDLSPGLVVRSGNLPWSKGAVQHRACMSSELPVMLPAGIRRTLLTEASGSFTVQQAAGPGRPYGMGEATTVLKYTVVPPPRKPELAPNQPKPPTRAPGLGG